MSETTSKQPTGMNTRSRVCHITGSWMKGTGAVIQGIETEISDNALIAAPTNLSDTDKLPSLTLRNGCKEVAESCYV